MFRYAIAEDAVFVAEIFKSCFQKEGGVCVAYTRDGGEIIDLIKETIPDLLVLDLVLPKKNGLQIAREAKALFPDLTILGCTSLEFDLIPMDDRKYFTEILAKPFGIETIRNFLNTWQRQAEKEGA